MINNNNDTEEKTTSIESVSVSSWVVSKRKLTNFKDSLCI